MPPPAQQPICYDGPRLDVGLAPLLAGEQLLVDEEGEKPDSDDEDNAEDDHDTGILAGPVAALRERREGVASDEGVVDGGHFVE